MDGSIEERSAFVSVVNQARSAIHASLGTWATAFKVEMETTTDALMEKADERLEAVSWTFSSLHFLSLASRQPS